MAKQVSLAHIPTEIPAPKYADDDSPLSSPAQHRRHSLVVGSRSTGKLANPAFRLPHALSDGALLRTRARCEAPLFQALLSRGNKTGSAIPLIDSLYDHEYGSDHEHDHEDSNSSDTTPMSSARSISPGRNQVPVSPPSVDIPRLALPGSPSSQKKDGPVTPASDQKGGKAAASAPATGKPAKAAPSKKADGLARAAQRSSSPRIAEKPRAEPSSPSTGPSTGGGSVAGAALALSPAA
eukprot:RCo035675